MVAGGVPTLQVLLDDGTGAFPYDITSYARLVEGYSCKRGRQDELSSPTPGEMTLVLDNTDGRFTLGSTTIATPSPIQIDQRVRVKVTPSGGSAVTRFTHAVNSWPVEWPNGSDLFSVAQITGVDAQAKAERRTLRSVIEEEILFYPGTPPRPRPTAYYPLSEPAGSVSAADVSGWQESPLTPVGAGADIVFGTAIGPGTDNLTAAQFNGGKYLQASFNDLSSQFVLGFEGFFSTSSDGLLARLVSNVTTDQVEVRVSGGKLVYQSSGAAAFTITGTTTVTDGATRHFAVSSDSGTTLVLEGASEGSNISVGGVGTAGTLYVGGAPGATSFNGVLAHIALPPPASLTVALAASHATAGRTGFAGEAGTARITRLAGYVSVPLGTLDTSLTNVPFVDFTGQSAMSTIQDVADAEMGTAFIDGSGNLIFHNRNRAVVKTSPDVTIDANFLAEGSQFIVDMQGVINYYETTAAGTGVMQVVRNAISELSDGTATHPGHGRYSASKTFLVQTDGEALDRANWIVATHAEPLPRVGQLAFDLLTMTAAQQAQMLALEPDSWLQVTGLPGQTPGGTTADFIVEGWSDALNAGEWTLTINAANKTVAAPGVWILDDTTWSVLGITTKLYV